jgi:regulator of CtrA degradation
MTEQGQMAGERGENLIDFMSRFTASEQFAQVFQEGMALVEETADYLDGPGRQEARRLDRAAALAYAAESMRLTTRLMQMASWLLLQKAVSSGELSEEAAREEQTRITIEEAGAPDPEMLEMLPEGLRTLIARTQSLHERIARLDEMIRNRETPPAENPLADHMERLARAFGGSVSE